jgi:hypothetical protein
MRTMMSHSAQDLMCMDSDGQKHPHGDKWNKDDCTRCKCRVSSPYTFQHNSSIWCGQWCGPC